MHAQGFITRTVTLAGALFLSFAAHSAPTVWYGKELPAFRVFGVNNAGQVVGAIGAEQGTLFEQAVLYSGGALTTLGTLGGSSRPTAINDYGHIVGFSMANNGDNHAFLYRDGSMNDLGTLGGVSSYAADINNDGTIVGTSETATGGNLAFIYDSGGMRSLGTLGGAFSGAASINSKGQVAGTANYLTNVAFHGFIYSNGLMFDIGTLYNAPQDRDELHSAAYDINDAGWVVGYSTDGWWSDPVRAFVIRDGVMTDLSPVLGSHRSSAFAINNDGQILGSYEGPNGVFLYDDGQVFDMTVLARTALGYDAQSGFSLNGVYLADGYIAGSFATTADPRFQAFLLSATPVDEPTTVVMMLMGLGLFGLSIRRQQPRQRTAHD